MNLYKLIVTELTKVFTTHQGPLKAVDRISFNLTNGEFFTMLGPSGCGKTTTLRMIAGLEPVTSGQIIYDGMDFTRFSASQRNIGMVFQSYALFPHMTVFNNVAYGMRIRKMAEAEIKKRVSKILDLTGLGKLESRYPSDLSGGQQQRVSIARSLVYEPTMLLLDEPLANIDAKLRIEMREEIRRIQKNLGIMTLYVTHDQEEAMSISDRMGVFLEGRLMQTGTPRELYHDPSSLFVADFIGKANFFPVREVHYEDSHSKVVFDYNKSFEMEITKRKSLPKHENHWLNDNVTGVVAVRPEHLKISPASGKGIPCRVQRIQFLGNITRFTVNDEQKRTEITVDSHQYVSGIHEGGKVDVSFDYQDAILFRKGE